MKAVAWTALVTVGLAIGATAQQTSRQPIETPDGGDRTDQLSFDQADKNKDGRVSSVEGAAISGFDFSNADANEDLFLSRPEFAAAMAWSASQGHGAPSARRSNRTAQVSFAATDTNKDGKIDASEAEGIPGFNFSRADVDDSHSVSRQEYQTAMATSRPRG